MQKKYYGKTHANDRLIEVRNLSFCYGRRIVLSDICLDVNRGEYIVMSGPNGGGKSSLLKLLLGLRKPSSGTVNTAPNLGGIGYMPQLLSRNDDHFPATVSEIVSTGLYVGKKGLRLPHRDDNKKVREILNQLSISGLADRRIGSLSGGQQQCVLLARAMVSAPPLIILDEPASALDPAMKELLAVILLSVNRKKNTTILLVTHDPDFVGADATRTLYLDKKLSRLDTHGKAVDT